MRGHQLPRMPSRSGRGRRRPRPTSSPQLLHHLQALLDLAAPATPAGPGGEGRLGRAERRRRQHLALAKRLLDPLPVSLRESTDGADHFWMALRWGGCGMVLVQLLGR